MTWIEADAIQRLQDPVERADDRVCRRCGGRDNLMICAECGDALCERCSTEPECEAGVCRRCMPQAGHPEGYLIQEVQALIEEMERVLGMRCESAVDHARVAGTARGMMAVWVGRLRGAGI